jgi:hypothetical protein
MANESITAKCVPTLAFPPPVKLSTKFASDIDEAEQASLSSKLFANKRASPNASTTAVVDYNLEELPPTQILAFHDDGIHKENHFLNISVLTAYSRASERN